MERNTSLDWRMQAIEDDLNGLQVNFQSGVQLSGQDRLIAQLSQRVQELGENPLWQEMQKTTVEIQQLKGRFNAVMKDIEHRLKQLEENIGNESSQQTMQEMKEKLHSGITDIEKRLIALEIRPVEPSISNVPFMEENPTTLTTFDRESTDFGVKGQ